MNYRLAYRGLIMSILTLQISACGHNSEEKQNNVEPIRVKTLTVADNRSELSSNYSGTVEEESGTVVSFSTAGTIKTLTVSEGDHVRKGQLIGTLDDGSLRNAYNIAVATLDQAKDAYNRMKQLHEANSLPDIKWVDVQSKLSQAESAEKIARIALDDAKLYSPVSGVVSEKLSSVGQTVAPGVPVVKIVDINSVKVCISVPENEVSKFNLGSEVMVSTKAAAGVTYTGKLIEKGIIANPLSRSYLMKYKVDNAEGKLLPGMICDVVIESNHASEGVVLPVSSVLLAADNTHFVWVDSADTARKRVVVTGTMLPDGVVIKSGLKNGDKVIVEGMQKVSNGTKVTSIN